MFETEKNYKKDQKSNICMLFWDRKKAVFDAKKQLFVETVFETQKRSIYLVFYSVLSFVHFFGPLKSN